MKHRDLLRENEEGSVLIYSVVVLLLLTVVGLMGSRTADYELKLSGNDRTIHAMRISADSAAAVAAQQFELLSAAVCRDRDWGSQTRLAWYSRGDNDQFDNINEIVEKNDAIASYTTDIGKWHIAPASQDINNWIPGNSAVLLDQQTGSAPAEFQNCQYQVIDVGITTGSSLGIGNNITNLHNLLISGSNQRVRSKCIVQIGYRKRF